MNDELRALCEEDIADARNFRAEESFVASQARHGRVAAAGCPAKSWPGSCYPCMSGIDDTAGVTIGV